MVKMMVL